MAVRLFDGTDDKIATSTGNLSAMTYGTVAAIVKFDSGGAGTHRQIFACHTSGNSYTFMLGVNPSNLWRTLTTGTPAESLGAATSTGVWYLVVMRKASGTAAPRYSVYNFTTTTWAHANGGTAIGNSTAGPGSSGRIKFNYTDSADFFEGRVAVRAAWANAVHWAANSTGDSQIVAAGLEDSVDNWINESPDLLQLFNQGSVSTPVEDLIGSADQTSITGTTVVTGDDPPGFVFITQTVTPNVLDTVSSVKTPTLILGTQFLSMSLLTTSSSFGDGPVISKSFSLAIITVTTTMHAPTVTITTNSTINAPLLSVPATLNTPSLFQTITVTRGVIESSDDAHELASAAPDLTNISLAPINDGAYMGIRFQDVQVPSDVVVTSATLTLILASSDKNDAEGSWYCQLIEDAPTFTVIDGDVDTARTKTSASVAWTTNDLGSEGASTQTPNLKTIVDEVFALEGWAPGNSLVFLYVHSSGSEFVQFYSYDDTTHAEPQLSITYLTIIIFIKPAAISAPVSMQTPTVGAGLFPGTLSVTTTMHQPTTFLDTQYIPLDYIPPSWFVLAPNVVAPLPPSGQRATVKDTAKVAAVQDTAEVAGITEAFLVTLQETAKATVEDSE
jgi:hypothetical protein